MSFRVEPDDLDDFADFLSGTMWEQLGTLQSYTWRLSAAQALKGALQPGDAPYDAALYKFEGYLRQMRETVGGMGAAASLRETADFYRTADDAAVRDLERQHAPDLDPPL